MTKRNSMRRLTLLNAVEAESNEYIKIRVPKQTAQKPPAMTRPTREDQSSMEVVVVTCSHIVAAVTSQRRMSHRLSSRMRPQAVQPTRELPSVLKLSRLSPIDDSDKL